MQTLIRFILKELSGQVPHCLPFPQHLFMIISMLKPVVTFEPRHEKTYVLGFRPGQRLEISDLESRGICVCAFVFA